ncbi:hypothetical protein NIES267_21290 [Calothrix parasitica NIES-267]|uniref:Uncharacterized protein n=1 Tax=Calothrix parasitica NIES-267 TaxID=1973488 RepID=A0A1Z4LN23_9CYAN|nr:hypothetical protein NIES267_21290 [Calothrix parasitica NIES-267]
MNMIRNLYVFVVSSCIYSTTILPMLGLPTNFSIEVKPFSLKVTILSSPRYIIDNKLPQAKLLSDSREN